MCCPLVFEFSVGIGGFVIGLGQISFFFSSYPLDGRYDLTCCRSKVLIAKIAENFHYANTPKGTPGFKSRIRPPFPQRVVKGNLMGRCVGMTV